MGCTGPISTAAGLAHEDYRGRLIEESLNAEPTPFPPTRRRLLPSRGPAPHRARRSERRGAILRRDIAEMAPAAPRARSARPARRPHAERYRPQPLRSRVSRQQAVLEG